MTDGASGNGSCGPEACEITCDVGLEPGDDVSYTLVSPDSTGATTPFATLTPTAALQPAGAQPVEAAAKKVKRKVEPSVSWAKCRAVQALLYRLYLLFSMS